MEPAYNLVLVHTPGWQDIADLEQIAEKVRQFASDIEVFIATNTLPCSVTRKHAARRPSLIFSPIKLLAFRPSRGKIYEGQVINKLDELARLEAAGLPIPPYEEIRQETRLSPERYGPWVVVKPSYELSSWGNGVELHRTETVRFRPRESFPDDHPGALAPMFAQKYIDCGRPMTCRVLTLFGEPLFTYLREAVNATPLDALTSPIPPTAFQPINQQLRISSTRDPDFLALAAAAYRALPEAALQACDILRDQAGNLHLLEINPGGGTWMFSNKFAPAYRKALGVEDLTAEFDAFTTCARLLVERTRAEAC